MCLEPSNIVVRDAKMVSRRGAARLDCLIFSEGKAATARGAGIRSLRPHCGPTTALQPRQLTTPGLLIFCGPPDREVSMPGRWESCL